MNPPSERSLAYVDRIVAEAEVMPTCDEAIALLREMLARAEAGDVVAVGICGVSADGKVGLMYHYGDHWSALTGAAAVLANHILTLR